jgi:hypothetical protein
MKPKLGQYVRDTSRNGIAGTVTMLRENDCVIRFGERGMRFIKYADCAVGRMNDDEAREKQRTTEQRTRAAKGKAMRDDPEVLRRARMCGLTPEEVIEAMR